MHWNTVCRSTRTHANAKTLFFCEQLATFLPIYYAICTRRIMPRENEEWPTIDYSHHHCVTILSLSNIIDCNSYYYYYYCFFIVFIVSVCVCVRDSNWAIENSLLTWLHGHVNMMRSRLREAKTSQPNRGCQNIQSMSCVALDFRTQNPVYIGLPNQPLHIESGWQTVNAFLQWLWNP